MHLASQDESLFTTNKRKAYSPSYLSQDVSKYMGNTKKLNLSQSTLRITHHIFRQAFAIIFTHNKVDLYSIMRSLGHEKIETTMIYLEKVFEKERHTIHSWRSDRFGEYI
ncbi:tyrosine-type recombinase/integrase [Sporosarcina sp.]|uniref:tyrosine-type recombinase/integrase n=1 Tax=Sporosarcina sp. TaxID=49982 RepID=UPI00261BABF4|nr:tyrosine-type recombinase/integrase [Sporosarcina sp.]